MRCGSGHSSFSCLYRTYKYFFLKGDLDLDVCRFGFLLCCRVRRWNDNSREAAITCYCHVVSRHMRAQLVSWEGEGGVLGLRAISAGPRRSLALALSRGLFFLVVSHSKVELCCAAMQKMKAAAAKFAGVHDFSNFWSAALICLPCSNFAI